MNKLLTRQGSMVPVARTSGPVRSQHGASRSRAVRCMAYKQDHTQKKVHQVCPCMCWNVLQQPVTVRAVVTCQLTQVCMQLLQEPNRVLKASLDGIMSTYYGTMRLAWLPCNPAGSSQSLTC
jgi:hypothetical protein